MFERAPTMKVKVGTPTEVLWEGEATSVSSENSQGPFDILPQHADFVTLIRNKGIIVRSDQGEKQYTFANSVIHSDKGIVRIYGDV